MIRALEPQAGLAQMQARRGLQDIKRLCKGPGCVGQALGITHAHNGMSLASSPFEIRPGHGDLEVITGPRIGISKAVSQPWRFGLAGSAYVSRPFRSD